MPSLANLFSRKSKSNVYPSLPAEPSSSKLRLPFSRKKSSAPTTTSSESQSTFGSPSPPRPSYLTRTSTASATDSDTTSIHNNRRLRPPPSKSAIFVAYADPHVALSTRSLPDNRSSSRRPETPPPPLPLQVPPPLSKDRDPQSVKPPKKHSFFNWGSKSTPNTPLSTPQSPFKSSSPHYIKKNLPDTPTDDNSFNLKAFRHISGTTNASDVSIGAPRPRGASITSESSQRISVAAFREAQARRSTADSQISSFRTPSPGPVHGKPMGSGANSFGSNPRAQSVSGENLAQRRSSNLAFTSESDGTSSEEEEEDSDADDVRSTSASTSQHGFTKLSTQGLHRQRTVTKRNSGNPDGDDRPRFRATKSESGHISGGHSSSLTSSQVLAGRNRGFAPFPSPSSPSPAPAPVPPPTVPSQISGSKSRFGGVKQTNVKGSETSREEPKQRSQSSLGFTPTTRQRASISVSAIMPNAAAKRASMTVAEKNGAGAGAGGEFCKFCCFICMGADLVCWV